MGARAGRAQDAHHAEHRRQRSRRARAAAPCSASTAGSAKRRAQVVLTQPQGGGVAARLHLGAGDGRSAAHGGAPAIARPARRQPDRPALEELRPLADRRLRDLDGRLRFGAALSDARCGDDPADPRARGGAGCSSSASSTAGTACGPAFPSGCRASRFRSRRPTTTCSGTRSSPRRAPLDGPPGARRRRALDDHVHVGHDRHAEGRDAQLRDVRLGARDRPRARAAGSPTRAC